MINIEETKVSPKIQFDPDKNTFLIAGESYPENSFSFYKSVFEWFENEFPKLERMEFHLKVSYMNSSSVKCILDIMTILDDAYKEGKDVKIKWFCEDENSRSLELAEDFKEGLELPFKVLTE